MDNHDPTMEEFMRSEEMRKKFAEVEALNRALREKQEEKDQDPMKEPGTPFPLPDPIKDMPPKPQPPLNVESERVDRRRNRKLTPEEREKMRLGRIMAKARREERKAAQRKIQEEEQKKRELLELQKELPASPLRMVQPSKETSPKVESMSPSPPPLKPQESISEVSPPELLPPPQPTLRILSEPNPIKEYLSPYEENDHEKNAFKEYLNTEYGPAGVEGQLRHIFQGGIAPIPPPNRWALRTHLDISGLVWEQVQTESFIDEIWPCVKLLLGEDSLNRQWAAGCCTILALFNMIRILPIVQEGLHDAERDDVNARAQ